jgi:hypothetical protein
MKNNFRWTWSRLIFLILLVYAGWLAFTKNSPMITDGNVDFLDDYRVNRIPEMPTNTAKAKASELVAAFGHYSDIAVPWFKSWFDDKTIYLEAKSDNVTIKKEQLLFENINRVCFSWDPKATDGIYVFTNDRENSHVVPLMSPGSDELVEELIKRGLFSKELIIEADRSKKRETTTCQPPL